MVVTGEFRGEYVAGCANDLCGYYGKLHAICFGQLIGISLVFLEHHYTQRGLLIKSYPLRGMLWSLICHLPTNTARDDDELEPPPVTRNGMDETPVAELASAYRVTPLKRTYAMLGEYGFMRCSRDTNEFIDITETLDIPTLCAPARREATEADVMKRLDHVGLTEDELKWLLKRLVRCKCSLLLTRGAFPNHRCINRDVIDLTQD